MRLEHSQQEHNGRQSANGSSQNGSSPHANGSARNGDANGFHSNGFSGSITQDTSPFFGHDREEVTRILLQSLSDLGYQNAAEQLSRESGYQLEIPSVAAFRAAVQHGEWDEAESLLFGSEAQSAADGEGGVSLGNGQGAVIPPWRKSSRAFGSPNGRGRAGLPLANGADVSKLKFMLREQKYLELLEQRDLGAALSVLRNELTTLKRDVKRLHTLSALMMCPSSQELRDQADWDGCEGSSRFLLLSDISKSISPSVMIPEHRLSDLFSTVQTKREIDCLYHNTEEQPSLYTDHECSADDFPLELLTELRTHTDEVWYVEFSHDGSMLATAGKDGLVTVFDTDRWKVKHEFREHERNVSGPDTRGVCYVTFSPNNKYLITCSQNNEFVVMNLDDGKCVAKCNHFDYPVTAAAWLPDSEHFIIGTQSSQRPLSLYSLRHAAHNPNMMAASVTEVYSWRDPPLEITARGGGNGTSFRVTDVAVARDGTRMAATTIDNRILTYDLRNRQRVCEQSMPERLTSINYSADGTLLLINMNGGEVQALDSGTCELYMSYNGARQEEFVLRSCFGGAGENFVMSGSEDSKVYIWRRQTGTQVAALDAHSPGTVNAVAWHPTNPAMFASAGDNRRVRIWTSANALRDYGASRPSGATFAYAR